MTVRSGRHEGGAVTPWRPFPPGAQALVPPGFIATRCPICGRGVVDASGDEAALAARDAGVAAHSDGHARDVITPVLVAQAHRDLVLNVARALDDAARASTNPVARVRGIRQARSLRHPWTAWLWELLPERPASW